MKRMAMNGNGFKGFWCMLAFLYFLLPAYVKADSTIVKTKLSNGNVLLKIAFNYAEPLDSTVKLRGLDAYYSIKFPLPNKWEVVNAKGYLKYDPSIFLLKNLSGGIIFFNEKVLRQFYIYDYNEKGVEFDIPAGLFQKHNKLTMEFIMHYTNECEDGAHSSIFSNIDLKNSYLELEVRPKPIKEEIASIANDVFDDKQYSVTPLNFVVDGKIDNKSLRSMALMTAVAAGYLKYRVGDIEVATNIDDSMHNILIGTKESVRNRLLNEYKDSFVFNLAPVNFYDFNEMSCLKNIVLKENISITSDGAWNGKSLSIKRSKLAVSTNISETAKSASVSFWVNSSFKERQALLSFGSRALFASKGFLGFTSGQRDFYGAKVNILDGKWHHIVAIFGKNGIEENRLFVNGEEIRLKRFDRKNIVLAGADFSNLVIGGLEESDKYNSIAKFDQMHIFDYPIKELDVYAIYQTSLHRKKRGLSESLFIDDRLLNDVAIFQNPNDPSKAIITIAPKDESRQEEIVFALLRKDLSMYHRSGYNLDKIKIPQPAKAYSAKGFVKDNEKIYFKDLGYETKLLKGWYPEKIKLPFKVYPDYYFSSKESLKTSIHYVFPSVIHTDSVVNIYLNNKFAKQVDIAKSSESTTMELATSLLFDLKTFTKMPIYLVNKGKNEMTFDFSLVPLKKGHCEIYNEENLVATVMDNSYFMLPKAKRWVEMPYMEYIRDAQYPFSIYPDLQDTVILLVDKKPATIAAALNFVFFLTEEIGSFPYYLTITDNLSEEDKNKNIIVFGELGQKKINELSKNAPIKFSDGDMQKVYPFIKRFMDHEKLFADDRGKKFLYKTIMNEKNFIDDNILMQLYRSPFNSDKVLLMLTASSSECLKKGVKSLIKFENRHLMAGDLLIYNTKKEDGIKFNIKDKYVLSQMSWFDTLALKISFNPWLYIVYALIFLIIFTFVVKYLLENFKRSRHGDVE